MIERLDKDTPIEIQDWLMFPYIYFSNLFENSELTLLDIACGNNYQYPMLKEKFKKVISMDNSAKGKNIKKGDILNIPLSDKSVDITFSFETIEHVEDHARVVSELQRVTKNTVIIGSVNTTGPSFIGEVEIFKGEKQPFHIKELSLKEWKLFFGNQIFLQSKIKNKEWMMSNKLDNKGYSNYVILSHNENSSKKI